MVPISDRIPVFKKKVASFLTKEDGKISKENLIKAGVLAAVVSVSAGINAKPVSSAAHVDCSSGDYFDCGGIDNPSDCIDCNDVHTEHFNSLSLSGGSRPVGTHNHCVQNCHTSHASHGSHGSGCCFPAGTMVSTATGKVAIQNIKEGDKVLSFNLETKETEEANVAGVISPKREGVYEINERLIKATNDHPFYTKKKNGAIGWAAIGKEAATKSYKEVEGLMALEIGDSILTRDGEWIEIKKIEYKEGQIKTYTLKVDKNRNFLANDLVVHNGTGSCGGWC